MNKDHMYWGDGTCWSCRKIVNICLDCPKGTAGNHYNHYGAGRKYHIDALNRLQEFGMITHPEFLPNIPINPRGR